MNLREDSSQKHKNTQRTHFDRDNRIATAAPVGELAGRWSAPVVCALRRNRTMIVVRKITKVALLAAYFGLFAMLMVAAGDFVLHG
jgi:hypothetical protein